MHWNFDHPLDMLSVIARVDDDDNSNNNDDLEYSKIDNDEDMPAKNMAALMKTNKERRRRLGDGLVFDRNNGRIQIGGPPSTGLNMTDEESKKYEEHVIMPTYRKQSERVQKYAKMGLFYE